MDTSKEFTQKVKKFKEDHSDAIDEAVCFICAFVLAYCSSSLGYRYGYSKGVANTLMKLW